MGRGAAAAGQPLYIVAGCLSDPPFGGHLIGNSRPRKPVCCHGVFVCALHGAVLRSGGTGRTAENVLFTTMSMRKEGLARSHVDSNFLASQKW